MANVEQLVFSELCNSGVAKQCGIKRIHKNAILQARERKPTVLQGIETFLDKKKKHFNNLNMKFKVECKLKLVELCKV